MLGWDGAPIRLLVRRTEAAARDMADWRVPKDQQDLIAENLRKLPVSSTDTFDKSGTIRFRKVGEDFEIAFQIAPTPDAHLVLVIGYDRVGEMQTWLNVIGLATLEASPAIVKAGAIAANAIVEGRKPKREL